VLDDHAHAELRGGDQHRDGSSQGAARRTFPSSIGARVAPTPAPAEDEPEGGWGCPRALSPCPSGQTSHRRPLDVNGRAWPDTPAERAFLAGGGAVEGSHRARRLLWQPRMNAGVPIGPRALLPALVTRALAHGVLHSAASFLLSPLYRPAPEDEVWVSCAADFDAHAPHPTARSCWSTAFSATRALSLPPPLPRGGGASTTSRPSRTHPGWTTTSWRTGSGARSRRSARRPVGPRSTSSGTAWAASWPPPPRAGRAPSTVSSRSAPRT